MTDEFDPMDHVVPEEDLKALDWLASTCLRKSSRELVAVEIGTWVGRTALVLAPHVDVLFCVDTWDGSPGDRMEALARRYTPRVAFQTFCRNMGDRLHQSVFPCVGHSLTWAAIWRRPIDFLYIDADHRYEAVQADIRAWFRHVRPGGIIAGHDYGLAGVRRAVNKEFGDSVKAAGANIWCVTKGES